VGLLCLAVTADRASLWLLYGVVLALGSARRCTTNAVISMVPMVADRDQPEAANRRLQSVDLVVQNFVGPPRASAVFVLAAVRPRSVSASPPSRWPRWRLAVAAVAVTAVNDSRAAGTWSASAQARSAVSWHTWPQPLSHKRFA
jgi:hypothetical protein